MDVKAWLSHKLDEPWSAYRLVTLLSNDIFEAIGRKLEEFEPIALCRILLSILHLRPPQVRELHTDIEALLQNCSSKLSSGVHEKSSDYDWVRLVAHSLRSFTASNCLDFEIQHWPEVHEQARDLLKQLLNLNTAPLYMLPEEAQYLDPSLCPSRTSEKLHHFQVTQPFLFEATKETCSTSAEPHHPSSVSTELALTPPSEAVFNGSTHKLSPVKSTGPHVPSNPDLERYGGFLPKRPVAPFKRKAAIKVMGLNDAAELQDRIRKRTRPTEAEIQQRRKEKEEQKQKDRMEREAKRIEEREAKKRKKEEDKELRRHEKEAARELKLKMAAEKERERARHKEEERMDRLSRQAAEVVMRETTAQMEMLRHMPPHLAHMQAQKQQMAIIQQQQQQHQPLPAGMFASGLQQPMVAAAAPVAGQSGPIVVAKALPGSQLSSLPSQPSPASFPHQFGSGLSHANAIHRAATAIQATSASQQHQLQQQQHLPPHPPQHQQSPLQHPQQPQTRPTPSSTPLFQGANKLTPEHRQLIEKFLSGQPVSHPNAKDGVLQVTMSENLITDPSGHEFLEVIVFEMNFTRGSWRKLKRRKRIVKHQ